MQNNTFSTLFVGQNLITLSDVDSTNNFLKELMSNSEPLPEGTVILAENQFAGRGQQESSWQAAPGKNLTFSLLLRPTFLSIHKQFLLNMAISIAVNQALTHYIENGLSIKWPNDIYYQDRKLGGVLIEHTIVGTGIKTAVVGIGINVNQLDFGRELKDKAVSIAQILQQDVNKTSLLHQICIAIEQLYFRLKAEDYNFLRETYVDRLYKLNKYAFYREKGEVFKGEITGVSDDGFLRLKRGDELRQYHFKEIEFLKNNN